ncbi:MAG: helix-turn-helix domain-containing protein [Vicinamibacteria bacterium]|nr:helix-turn-helix domain-containing protein [Vicinamibacteria bacterium]
MADQDSHFLDTLGAARFLGADEWGNAIISPKTLERWRVEGSGPRFVKLGRRVGYRRQDLLDWAASRTRRSTSDIG